MNKPIRLFWGENYAPKPKIVNQAIQKAVVQTLNNLHLYPGILYADTISVVAHEL